MFEDEDDVEYVPGHDEVTSDEEVGLDEGEQQEVFVSRNGKMAWSKIPYETKGLTQAQNIIRMTPGPARFAVSHVQDIKIAFEPFIPQSIQTID